MLGRERRRLARAFRLAMAAAAAPGVMMACNGGSGGDDAVDASVRDAGADDATLATDAATPPPGDAGAGDAATKAPLDAGDAGSSIAPPFDAGADADAYALGGCYTGGVDLDSGFGVDAPVGQDTCAYFYGCGVPQGLAAVGCTIDQVFPDGSVQPIPGETCWIAEDAGCANDAMAPGEGGAITILCNPCFGGGGRRPAGVGAPAACGATPVGAFLAGLAFEEEASIAAFERLEHELVTHGAPRALVSAARRAARDETRHARVMGRLARRHGGDVAHAPAKRSRRRSLAAIGAENAAEGCVRETFGALLARWQATHAADATLRAAFEVIARDEARHAALAWSVARWVDSQLDAKGRARVAAARARAFASLEAVFEDPEESLRSQAGLPSAARSRALLAAMGRALGLTTDARR